MNLKVNNLSKSFANTPVFNNLSLEIPENKITCILGPSGCGKTTLSNILTGLESYDTGNISDFENKSFSAIFQEPRLLPWKSVEDNINFVLDHQSLSDEKDKIDDYINMVGLEKAKSLYPSELSGGMKQRVSIARAFIYPSDILIMDEPFTGLDIKIKKDISDRFLSLWHKDQRTVIYITHELSDALMFADQIIVFPKDNSQPLYNFLIDLPKEDRNSQSEELKNLRNELKRIFLDS